MSKVKGEIYDLNKTKLRHNLRRVESKKKERIRRKNYKNDVYGWLNGYYVTKGKYIGVYEKELVPKTERDIVETYWTKELVPNEDGVLYEKFTLHKKIVGKKVVPEHYHKKLIEYKLDPNYNVLKRCDGKMKPYRKAAERLVRAKLRDLTIIVPKGSGYKKLAEVQWERW